jgi:Ca-activated chloride channel family protein
LYEIIPAGQDVPLADEKGDLQYQKTKPSAGSKNDDLLTLRLRYKQPKPGAASELIQTAVSDKPTDKMSENLTLAAAAASFGLVLRNSTYKGSATLTSALSLAESAAKNDRFGYRTELCKLIRQANKKREVRSER